MRTYHFPEMAQLADGPWNKEPDKAQWIDKATDLDCLIVRTRFGGLCGYVGVPPGHRYYNTHYSDVDVVVGRSLNFAGRCEQEELENRGICHIPEPGRPADVWWLGFDCLHAWDFAPGFVQYPSLPRWKAEYRTFEYVKREVEKLAAQLTLP